MQCLFCRLCQSCVLPQVISTSPPFLCWAFHLPGAFLLSMGRDGPHIRPAEIAEENSWLFLKCLRAFLCAKLGFSFSPTVLSVGLPKYLIISSETFLRSSVRHVYANSLFFHSKGDLSICVKLLILRGLCYIYLRCFSCKWSVLMLSDHTFLDSVCLFILFLFQTSFSCSVFTWISKLLLISISILHWFL